jgi:hypothetical protein
VVLLAGFGIGMPDDHLIDKSTGGRLEDALYYEGMIGIHINLGL